MIEPCVDDLCRMPGVVGPLNLIKCQKNYQPQKFCLHLISRLLVKLAIIQAIIIESKVNCSNYFKFKIIYFSYLHLNRSQFEKALQTILDY